MSLDVSNLFSMERPDLGRPVAKRDQPPPLPGELMPEVSQPGAPLQDDSLPAAPPAPIPPPPPVPPPDLAQLPVPDAEDVGGGWSVDLPSFLGSAVVHLTLLVTLALWSSGLKTGIGTTNAPAGPLVASVGDERAADASENLTVVDDLTAPVHDEQ